MIKQRIPRSRLHAVASSGSLRIALSPLRISLRFLLISLSLLAACRRTLALGGY